jgi:hypothetical protein
MIRQLDVLGNTEVVTFRELGINSVPARIDTGARTSSVWASKIDEKDGSLRFTLFDERSKYYTGETIETKNFGHRAISSSNGHVERRYTVELVINILGRNIRATFTLANRSSQAYPVLVGRNILRGKFVVDVTRENVLSKGQRRPKRQPLVGRVE